MISTVLLSLNFHHSKYLVNETENTEFKASYVALAGEDNGTHSSTLAWRITWTEEPGRLQSMGSRRVGHDWATSLSLFTFMHWRRKLQPTPVFLPGESVPVTAEPGGLPSMGSPRVGHDWSDLAAAAGGTSGKEPACQCRRCERHRLDPWVQKILWRRAWQPTPVFVPGESHGQRKLAGYSP